MLSQIIFTATALVALVAAQSTTVQQSMPPVATAAFNPVAWCRSEKNICQAICGGIAPRNDCDENGTVPDVTAYQFSLPYYICQETYIQCINAHPNDLEGQTTCRNNEQCGNLTAPALGAAVSSASSSATSGSATASGSAAAATSSKAAAPGSVNNMANGALAIVLAAAMRLIL